MKLINYIEEKMGFLIYQLSFLLLFSIFLISIETPFQSIIFFNITITIVIVIYLALDYYILKKQYDDIIKIVDTLEDKHFIAEIIPKPNSLKNRAYYYALKKACKSMNDIISQFETENKDYQEYVESFVHEIKTPISALLLFCENNKNDFVREEVRKIDNLIEQMLFFARSETTEKDYFVKKIKVEDLLHPTLLNYKEYFTQNKITLKADTHGSEVYTDEKWLNFIIGQIIQNSIKYLDKNKKVIEITCQENENNTLLIINDNGIGIKESDITRIFEKGFTGSDRNKKNSTGIGLYLCKKLCDRLDLNILIESKEKEYTKVTLIFPKGKVHKF